MKVLASIEKSDVVGLKWHASGLKKTRPRALVWSLLEDAWQEGRHVDAETLYKHALLTGEAVSSSTIYRALAEFEQAGCVQAHSFLGMRKVYELDLGQSRDHLVNLDTKQISHLEPGAMEPYYVGLAKTYGVVVVQRDMTLYVREGPIGDESFVSANPTKSRSAERMMRIAVREATA